MVGVPGGWGQKGAWWWWGSRRSEAGGQEGTSGGVPGGRQWAWGLWVTLIVLGGVFR